MSSFYSLLIFFSFLALVTPYLESDSWLSVELRHALDKQNPDRFTFRGNISIPSLNLGEANVVHEPLSLEERQNLKKLAEANQFYRLKAIAVYPDGTRSEFLTSTKACALANSQLSDFLWVSIDTVGSVLAITQTVSGIGNCQDFHMSEDDLENFNTHVFVKQTDLAPVPDTPSFIQKLDREREARERGEVKDNRGFFAKYWMYIVPVGLLVLISGATNPDNGGGGGGR